MSTVPALKAEGIFKSYRTRPVLKGVSLAGAIRAEKGSILYHGTEAFGNPRVFAREAAYVPQENPLIEELSVRDNLRL